MMGRIVNIFYRSRTMPLLRSGGIWRALFAHGRACVALEPTEMDMARTGELDGIGVFAEFVCFAGPEEIDTTDLREST